jgi:hypothetical protein
MRSITSWPTLAALSLIVSGAALAGGSTSHRMAPQTAPTTRTAPTTLGPSHTGQPNQSCETTPNTPGNSAAAPGSAFNPSGQAGTVYAGEQPQNSRNTASVSQYDVACARSR